MNVDNCAESAHNGCVHAGPTVAKPVIHVPLRSGLVNMAASFRIFIKSTGKSLYSVDVNPEMKSAELKALVEQRDGIPVDQQRLFFASKELQEDLSLTACVRSESIIFVVLKGGRTKEVLVRYALLQ